MSKKEKKNDNVNNSKVRLLIILVVVILIIAFFSFAGYWFYKNYEYEFKLNTDNIVVNLDDKIDASKYIKKKKNLSVTIENVSTKTIGNKKIKYIAKDKFGKKHIYYLSVRVIDNIPPVIEGKEKVNLYVGDKIDLNKYIKAKDNYDEKLTTIINGEVNTKKEGKYTVQYIVSDQSNNKTEFNITFNVKKKEIITPIKLDDGSIGVSSKGYTIENKDGATYIKGILVANKTYPLSSTYGSGLTKATSNAFNEMKAAASLDGFELYIGSGFRSFKSQTSIYKSNVKKDGQKTADTYSARPGHSEHQTGLAIDICAKGDYKCIGSAFNNTKPAKWLSENAYKYGFILRYPSGKTDETGYKFESWHYRYVGKELASLLYNDGNWLTLESYLGITSKYSY